jgi:hypothetical protein
MKMKRKSKANRWIIGLIVFAVLVGFGAVYATDICHTYTADGYQEDLFEPAANENFYMDAKAPASGDLWAAVDLPGQVYVAQISVSDGQRQGVIINRNELANQNEFRSRVSGYSSGTGYANLRSYSKTSTSSNCIPTGNNQ